MEQLLNDFPGQMIQLEKYSLMTSIASSLVITIVEVIFYGRNDLIPLYGAVVVDVITITQIGDGVGVGRLIVL